MRRQSFSSSLSSSSGGGGEPLIVVEESTLGEEDEETEKRRSDSPPRCLDPDSPSLNPYLLSPWRDSRKHSLPTPQCTSGITASQVRRLSERGGEGSGPSPREAAFLATLSQSQPPQPGGRRHSVVTISRVPTTLFGRNRRESIAAFPIGAGSTRILGSRRDSSTGMPSGPPSQSGSTHNLALDIMDDIAEIKAARKVRLKMWKTPSHERVCEVQPLDEVGSSGYSAASGSGCPVAAQRYTQNQQQQRRYSDFGLTTILPNVPLTTTSSSSLNRRRASEMPQLVSQRGGTLIPPPIPPRSGVTPPIPCSGSSGIVCTNTDLISILSSLTSSATEIDRCGVDEDNLKLGGGESSSNSKNIEQKRNRLKNSRSNSFDVSILHEVKQGSNAATNIFATSKINNNVDNKSDNSSTISPSSWFAKRHQPMSKKQRDNDSPSTILSFKFEKSRVVRAVKDTLTNKTTSPTKEDVVTSSRNKVVWDDTSGTKVDAEILGNAIEEFLRSGVTQSDTLIGKVTSSSSNSWYNGVVVVDAGANNQILSSSSKTTPESLITINNSSGKGGNNDKSEQKTTCESSICSSLKDLFVK